MKSNLRVAALLAVGVLASVTSEAAVRGTCTGCANPSFATPPNVGRDVVQLGFAVADFNRDGRLDLALPSSESNQFAAHVYLGDGRGGFDPDPKIVGPDTFAYTRQAVAADLNVDGLPDLLLLSDGKLRVFLGLGAGDFVAAGPAEGIPFGNDAAAADFDGDGWPDLVTPVPDQNGVVELFRGRGDGTFESPSSVPAGAYPTRLVVGDFDGDLKSDVAALGEQGTVAILLGDGAGHLVPGATVPYSGRGLSIVAGNFDTDDDLDLAVGGSDLGTNGFVTILVGNGAGGFAAGDTYAQVYAASSMAAADVTGDGDLDLVVIDTGLLGLTLYPGAGGATFDTPTSYGIWGDVVALGDFDRDGHPDAAVASRGARVVRNAGDGSFLTPPASPIAYPSDALLADLDGDGNLDLVVATFNDGPGAVWSYMAQGDGTFSAGASADITFQPQALSVGNFTADTSPDVLLSNGTQVVFLPGDGAGQLGPASYFDAGTFPRATALADFDGDGNLDAAVLGQSLEILTGDGAGSFTDTQSIDQGGVYVAAADLDGQDGPDILLVNGAGLAVLLNDGTGTFGAPVFYASVSGRFVVGDFDENGSLDVAGDSSTGTTLLKGDGLGGFLAPETVLPEGSYFVSAADFNGDGHLDLLLSGDTWASVSTGNGDGAFAAPSPWAVPLGSLPALTQGDVNGDGRPDIVAADRQAVSLLNTNCLVRKLGLATDVSTCAAPGQPFPQQPVAGIYDDGGNLITCDTDVVSASIVPGTGAPGALLAGTTDVAASAGLAAYTDLAIGPVGVGYVLEFSHPVAGITRSRALTVGDPPLPPAASNSGPFCQGQTLNLYATTVPGAVYRWTGPNGFFASVQSPVIPAASLEAAGDYSVVALVNGCESSAATTTVEALPPAPGPAIVGPIQVCAGSRLVLHVDDGAPRHTWYRDGTLLDGETGAVLSIAQADPTTAGDYTASSSDATGCTTDVSAPLSVEVVITCQTQPIALSVDPSGNGVLEPGESAVLDPTRKNLGGTDLTLIGTLGLFTGIAGGSYVIQDGTADYGTLAPQAQGDCLGASGDCYQVTVTADAARPATHWDAFIDENPGTDPAYTWILHVGGSFADVPTSNPFYAAIESVLHNGITAGCTPTTYCPSTGVTRAQMAVLLLKAKYGESYAPPTPITQTFADVPLSNPFASWIEELASLGITAGCGNGNYCPNQVVNRAQMAVFLLKTAEFPAPPCTGIFGDVPCPGGFAVDYVEALYALGVTGGCNTSPLLYCPTNPNTRGQMAVFLTKTFGLSLYGP